MKEYVCIGDTMLVEDETTIYEIDLNCYRGLSEEEKRTYFSGSVREAAERSQ